MNPSVSTATPAPFTSPPVKRYYMFIGNVVPDQMGQKSIRFVIESENGIVSPTNQLRGPVVATMQGKQNEMNLGYRANWCNPIDDMLSGFAPSVIPVNAEYVLNNFDFIGQSVVDEVNAQAKAWHDHSWRDSPNPPPYVPKKAKGTVRPSF